MVLDRERALETEVQIIQSRLDKYDDLIWRNRAWLIPIWAGTIAVAITGQIPRLSIGSVVLVLISWVAECSIRFSYQLKYIDRYVTIRNALNGGSTTISDLPLYDLTNALHPRRMKKWVRFRRAVLKPEPLLFFAMLAAASLAAWKMYPWFRTL